MKNMAVIIFVVLMLVILGLTFASFQVRETESALVMTFDTAPDAPITEPGWYFKWPPPIQRVYKFDSRLRILEAERGEPTTKGAVPIIVNTYIVWKIADPLLFYNRNDQGSIRKAEDNLLSRINDTQNRVIGRYSFGQFVNSDPAEIKLEELQEEMLDDMEQHVMDTYGIEVKAIGIKQFKVSKDVTNDVFERMKAERQTRTETTISEGNAEAASIKKDAELKRAELLAAAQARAKAIRGKGDAEAAKYYKMLAEDPEFAMFLQSIETAKATLAKNATIVIKADSEPFNVLRQKPLLTPKDPNETKE